MYVKIVTCPINLGRDKLYGESIITKNTYSEVSEGGGREEWNVIRNEYNWGLLQAFLKIVCVHAFEFT
jgi:hypothetical protein